MSRRRRSTSARRRSTRARGRADAPGWPIVDVVDSHVAHRRESSRLVLAIRRRAQRRRPTLETARPRVFGTGPGVEPRRARLIAHSPRPPSRGGRPLYTARSIHAACSTLCDGGSPSLGGVPPTVPHRTVAERTCTRSTPTCSCRSASRSAEAPRVDRERTCLRSTASCGRSRRRGVDFRAARGHRGRIAGLRELVRSGFAASGDESRTASGIVGPRRRSVPVRLADRPDAAQASALARAA